MLLVAEHLAAPAGKRIADVARMAHSDGIAFRDGAHERLAKRRRHREQRAFKDATEHDCEKPRTESGRDEDDSRQAGNIEHGLTSQEDVLKLRKARKRDIHEHADEHDHGRCRTIIHECHGNDGLVARYDPLHAKRELEHFGKRIERIDEDAGAAGEDEKASKCLDAALDDLRRLFLLQDEAEDGEESDKQCRRLYDADEEVLDHDE